MHLFSDSLSRKTFIVLYSLVDLKSASKEKRARLTQSTLSPTAHQSWRKVHGNVCKCFRKVTEMVGCNHSNLMLKRCGERGGICKVYNGIYMY